MFNHNFCPQTFFASFSLKEQIRKENKVYQNGPKKILDPNHCSQVVFRVSFRELSTIAAVSSSFSF